MDYGGYENLDAESLRIEREMDDDLTHYMRRCSELRAEVERLREALKKYGHHKPYCSSIRTPSACECGWFGIRKTLEGVRKGKA